MVLEADFDHELRHQVKTTPSDLAKLPDAKLPGKSAETRKLATQHLEAAGKYGLTQEHINLLETREKAYDAVVVAPRGARNRTSRLTRLLDEEFRSITQFLEDILDQMMLLFREDHPDFFAEYKRSRRIGKRTGFSAPRNGDSSGSDSGADTNPDVSAPSSQPEDADEATASIPSSAAEAA